MPLLGGRKLKTSGVPRRRRLRRRPNRASSTEITSPVLSRAEIEQSQNIGPAKKKGRYKKHLLRRMQQI